MKFVGVIALLLVVVLAALLDYAVAGEWDGAAALCRKWGRCYIKCVFPLIFQKPIVIIADNMQIGVKLSK